MSNSLKPAIRFKEFTNAWEQRRVGDIVLPYRIKNNLGLNLKSYSISNKYGFVYQNDFFKNGGKAVFANKRNSLIVEPFSFAYNPARIDVGSIGYYKNNESCLISPLYEVFKTQENINDRFILCWFKSNLFSKIINNNKEGSVRNTLYIRNILDEFISTPSIYEQQNISSLFSSLDTSITLHQRKLEKLKNIKNMLLEKMFADEKNLKPAIRFKEFTNDWEQRRVGDILIYIRPDKFSTRLSVLLDRGKYPVLTANKSLIIGYSNELNTYIEKCIIFDDFTLDFKFINFPFLLKSSAIKILKTGNNDNLLEFIHNLFYSLKFEKLGHARHYINVVQNKIVNIPSITEQQKISNTFLNLDSLITLQKRKLEKLKNIKNMLLEKMFVNA